MPEPRVPLVPRSWGYIYIIDLLDKGAIVFAGPRWLRVRSCVHNPVAKRPPRNQTPPRGKTTTEGETTRQPKETVGLCYSVSHTPVGNAENVRRRLR